MACVAIGGAVGSIVGLVVATVKKENLCVAVFGGLLGVAAGVAVAVVTGTL
jgi:hypothetical protein